MLRPTLALLVSLLIASATHAQVSDRIVHAPEAGFRLVIPDDAWTHTVQQGPDGLSSVAVGPADAGGLVALTIQVSAVNDNSVEALAAHVDALQAAVANDASITSVDDHDVEIAGKNAHGIRVVQEAAGQVFRVYVVFLRDRGFQYRVQFHAPRDRFDELWPTARRILDGFELIELDDAAKKKIRLRELADKCGSQIDWASNWDDAAARARAAGRLIVVSVFAQPGFQLGNALNEGVFMDPEVVALMDHRFVGWRWQFGQPAPFVDHNVFGLSATTFGIGLLICDPDGHVLRQIFFPEASVAIHGMRDVLAQHPDLAPPPVIEHETRAQQAAFLIDSGQLDEARSLLLQDLVSDRSAALDYQRARLHRIQRHGPAALQSIKSARKGLASTRRDAGVTVAELDLEEASVHLGMGNYSDASRLLAECLEHDPSDASRALAMVGQGLLALTDRDPSRARECWEAVTSTLPERPGAWIAAAGLLGPVLEMEEAPSFEWPSDRLLQLATLPAPAIEVTMNPDVALLEAVEWLLAHQREDGSWNLPFSERDTHPAPNAITMASQAICVHTLARVAQEMQAWPDAQRARCRDAAIRGLRRYLAGRDLVREHPRQIMFMDYTCWGSAYGLQMVSAALDETLGLRDRLSEREMKTLRSEADALVADLVRIQAPNGGWSYYVSGVINGATSGTAMSFTTATVITALQAAVAQSIEVPDDVLAQGYACLSSMRGSTGAWEYMRQGDGPHQAGDVLVRGGAARGPLCARALRDGNIIGDEAMKPAFAAFAEHLGLFGAESRKALMHAGPDAQGSHYLLYDYSTAAAALKATDGVAVDDVTRHQVRAAITREMAKCRNADGSFIDNPLIGAAPGTGLAVSTLLDLM